MKENHHIKNVQIVIWGNDNYNSLGLLRELHIFCDQIFFIIHRKNRHCASLSRYCKRKYVARNLNEAISVLINGVEHTSKPKLLIPTGDLFIEKIDEQRHILQPYYILPGTVEQGKLTSIINKNNMTCLAAECGLLVPDSMRCQAATHIEAFPCPCILKPSKKIPGVSVGFKTKVFQSTKELNGFLIKANKEYEYILQSYVPKDKDLLVYGCRTSEGKTIFAGAFIKDRWSPFGDGSHGVIHSEIPSCISKEAMIEFLQRIDYSGLFSFEFGLCGNHAYFYEINLRNDGTSHYFYQAGINIPEYYVMSELGALPHLGEIHGQHYFIDEFDDKHNVKTGNVSLGKWKDEYEEADIFKYKDNRDWMPYIYKRCEAIAYKITKIIGLR